MRKEYDFSKGTRGKHVGQRIRIAGDDAGLLVVPKGTLNERSKLMTPAGQKTETPQKSAAALNRPHATRGR